MAKKIITLLVTWWFAHRAHSGTCMFSVNVPCIIVLLFILKKWWLRVFAMFCIKCNKIQECIKLCSIDRNHCFCEIFYNLNTSSTIPSIWKLSVKLKITVMISTRPKRFLSHIIVQPSFCLLTWFMNRKIEDVKEYFQNYSSVLCLKYLFRGYFFQRYL